MYVLQEVYDAKSATFQHQAKMAVFEAHRNQQAVLTFHHLFGLTMRDRNAHLGIVLLCFLNAMQQDVEQGTVQNGYSLPKLQCRLC